MKIKRIAIAIDKDSNNSLELQSLMAIEKIDSI